MDLRGIEAFLDRLTRQLNFAYGIVQDKVIQFYQHPVHLDYNAGWQAGDTVDRSVSISAEGDFVVTHISCGLEIIAGVDPFSTTGQIVTSPHTTSGEGAAIGPVRRIPPTISSGPIDLRFTDGASDRQKSADFVPAHVGYGPGSHPLELKRPWLIRRNSNARVESRIRFGSLDNAEQIRGVVVLTGYKIYPERLDLFRRV